MTVHHTGSATDERYEVVVNGLSSQNDCDNPPISVTAEVTVIGPSGNVAGNVDFNNGKKESSAQLQELSIVSTIRTLNIKYVDVCQAMERKKKKDADYNS